MWRQFAEESEKPISSQVSSEYRKIYSILETSYKFMENEEKKMFFFLACLSPLDSAISVDNLMRYGIGLDLFQRVNNLSQAMKQASGWVDELVLSSLLLKGDDGKVRIHDVVRASAISFVEKGKDYRMLVESIPRWMCKETFKKFAAISLLSGHDFSRLCGVKAPMLQILLLKGDESSTTLSSNFFQGMRDLKVLCLSNIDFTSGLPTSIKLLKRLKILHLHNCKLKDVKLIGKLGNLLVLSLRKSTLDEIPNEIGELCNLRLLDMRGCKGIINIPGNILSRLSNLEGLYMSDSFNNWASMKTEAGDPGADNKASVSELNKLNHLNVLTMKVQDAEQLLTLNEDKLIEKLEDFRIQVGRYDQPSYDLLEEPSYSRVLRLDGIDPSQNKFLKAILKKTFAFEVHGSLTENFVPQLDEEDEGFKDLIHLAANACNDVKSIISLDNHNESSAFVNLETLKLYNMENIETICDGKAPARSFSNLESLALCQLPKLTYGLPLTLVPLKLVEVTIEECESLKYFIVDENVSVPSEENGVAKKDTDSIEFELLESMKLHDVPSLKSVLGRADTIDDAAQPFFHDKCAFLSLEELDLQDNKTIVRLWSKIRHVRSFGHLKDIRIERCQEIQSLGSPSVFAALVQLESLSIEECEKLQEVITKETQEHELREHVIVLPRLKYLHLFNLTHLESFSGGSYKLDFPILVSLRIWGTPRLTHFARSQNSSALICDKCAFPSLEFLTLIDSETMMLWSKPYPKLRTLVIQHCGELQSLGSPSIFAELRHLELLSIFHCDKLQEVITTETETETETEGRDHIIVFPHLKRLYLDGLSNLQCFYGGSYQLKFPFLNELILSSTYSIDFRKSANSTTVFPLESAISSLEQLTLSDNQTIVTLFSDACHVSGFRYLKNLDISDCPEFRTLGSLSVFAALLRQLEGLRISNCDKLEEVIAKEKEIQGVEVGERIIVCSRLKVLHMNNLSNLQTFYKGSCTLKFPKLTSLRLSHLINLANFVGSKSSTALFSDQIEFPCLEELEACDVSNKATSLWNWCESNEQRKVVPNSLKRLTISECKNMEMIIMDKDKLVGDIEGHVYEFAGLERLTFKSLPKFICVAYAPTLELCFPSLESVELESCTELESFCSGPFQAPKLEMVCLSKCPNIKWFIRGDPENGDVLEMPSLDRVYISECSDMHLFTRGQIKAPKLRLLKVNNIDYCSKNSSEEKQHLLQNLHMCTTTTREVEEDTEDKDAEED